MLELRVSGAAANALVQTHLVIVIIIDLVFLIIKNIILVIINL